MDRDFRIGIGSDLHKLGPGTHLIVGGISIPYSKSAMGHSDADVLIHSLIDALLGAACLGDIGRLFPDSDPKYSDVESATLLGETMKLISHARWELVNIDATLKLEQPKIGPYNRLIRESLANITEIDIDHISIKAKTGEGIGEIGLGNALGCECAVLLSREPIT